MDASTVVAVREQFLLKSCWRVTWKDGGLAGGGEKEEAQGKEGRWAVSLERVFALLGTRDGLQHAVTRFEGNK